MKYKCRLKSILADLDIKLGEFADQIRIDKSTMSALVNNKSLPSFDTLYTIVEELERINPNLTLSDIWIRIEESQIEEDNNILNEDISYLDFSDTVYRHLKRNGIHTSKDLLNCNVKKLRGIGEVKAKEILEKIEEINKKLEVLNENKS